MLMAVCTLEDNPLSVDFDETVFQLHLAETNAMSGVLSLTDRKNQVIQKRCLGCPFERIRDGDGKLQCVEVFAVGFLGHRSDLGSRRI